MRWRLVEAGGFLEDIAQENAGPVGTAISFAPRRQAFLDRETRLKGRQGQVIPQTVGTRNQVTVRRPIARICSAGKTLIAKSPKANAADIRCSEPGIVEGRLIDPGPQR